MSPAPPWTRAIVAALGLATLVFGGLCFIRSDLLFGVDAFRTLARVPIGLLGATTIGLGVSALSGAWAGDLPRVRASGLPMLLASLFVPPVIGFNIGAFDQTGTSGFRTISLVVGFSLFCGSPLVAAMLVLNRLGTRATAP